MIATNCFDILLISRDATLDEAKEAYKRLVKLWHPDQYGNFPEKQMIAQEKLKEINVAYRDIVTILKHNPVATKRLPVEKDKKVQHGKNLHGSKKKETTFWNKLGLFFNDNFLKSNHPENLEKNGPPISSAPKQKDAAFVVGKGGIEPDFQQVFKRAVRERRQGGVTGHRQEKRRRSRGQLGNSASYQVKTTFKRSPGNRVEKISPVVRVNRIGDE